MSLQPYAILTLSQAKAALKIGIDAVDTSRDTVIENFVNVASGYIETLIGGHVVLQDVDCLIDGSGGDSLYPPYPRFVQMVGNTVPEQLDSLQARSAYNEPWQNLFSSLNQFSVINEPSIKNFHRYLRRLDGYVFPEGVQNIRLFFKDGFSTIPEEFKQCCAEMIEILWNESPYGNKDLGKDSITRTVEGQTSTIKLKSMDKRWKELIGMYIREELQQ